AFGSAVEPESPVAIADDGECRHTRDAIASGVLGVEYRVLDLGGDERVGFGEALNDTLGRVAGVTAEGLRKQDEVHRTGHGRQALCHCLLFLVAEVTHGCDYRNRSSVRPRWCRAPSESLPLRIA